MLPYSQRPKRCRPLPRHVVDARIQAVGTILPILHRTQRLSHRPRAAGCQASPHDHHDHSPVGGAEEKKRRLPSTCAQHLRPSRRILSIRERLQSSPPLQERPQPRSDRRLRSAKRKGVEHRLSRGCRLRRRSAVHPAPPCGCGSC